MPWGDARSVNWSDVAYGQNQDDISDYRGGNPAWRSPEHRKGTPYDAPGNDGMFDRHSWSADKPGRAFTSRKKHGWWGKEEYFDAQGRKIG